MGEVISLARHLTELSLATIGEAMQQHSRAMRSDLMRLPCLISPHFKVGESVLKVQPQYKKRFSDFLTHEEVMQHTEVSLIGLDYAGQLREHPLGLLGDLSPDRHAYVGGSGCFEHHLHENRRHIGMQYCDFAVATVTHHLPSLGCSFGC